MRCIPLISRIKVLSIFVIILVITLTPAFAVEMAEIAQQAEQYNIDSKEEMGFWGKISFMARGYWLLSDAEQANQKSAGDGIEEESDDDKYDKMSTHYLEGVKQAQKLLEFRNNKIYCNSSSNGTNSTNGTCGIPIECQSDAGIIITMLSKQGINVTQSRQENVDMNIKGKLVQLINEKGLIHYVYVNDLVLTGKNSGVTVTTNTGIENHMSLNEFKKAYTGIVLTLQSQNEPINVVNTIVNLQKSGLKTQEYQALEVNEKIYEKLIKTGIIAAVALVLVIVGIILAIYFWNTMVPAIAAQSQSLIINEMFVEDIKKITIPFSDIEEEISELIIGLGRVDQEYWFGTVVTVDAEYVPEVAATAASQNYVSLILKIIGIVLFTVGIVLILACIVFGIYYGVRYLRSNYALSWVKSNYEDYNENNTKATNLSGINKTQLLNKIHNTSLTRNSTINI